MEWKAYFQNEATLTNAWVIKVCGSMLTMESCTTSTREIFRTRDIMGVLLSTGERGSTTVDMVVKDGTVRTLGVYQCGVGGNPPTLTRDNVVAKLSSFGV